MISCEQNSPMFLQSLLGTESWSILWDLSKLGIFFPLIRFKQVHEASFRNTCVSLPLAFVIDWTIIGDSSLPYIYIHAIPQESILSYSLILGLATWPASANVILTYVTEAKALHGLAYFLWFRNLPWWFFVIADVLLTWSLEQTTWSKYEPWTQLLTWNQP